MSLSAKNICDRCDVRVPKNRPILRCSHCKLAKHYKCQNLSRADAQNIINYKNNIDYDWICNTCTLEILPVNACTVTICRTKHTGDRFKVKCHCCGGQSYSPNNVLSCPWCDQLCHKKCINLNLGCNKCCDDIIPGFRVHNYELYGVYGNIRHVKSSIFNPYSHTNNINLIGDIIENEEENNNMWNEVSDFLIRCTYKEPKNILASKPSELSVLSLNIRSLQKKLPVIIDNISEYQKYDVICFNETNCNIEKLAHGIDDLLLEGFHPPLIQAPVRSTCRGGGLITYVNAGVCCADDVEMLDVGHGPTQDCEFLFVKLRQCKKVNRSVIIGNIYRSPSRKPSDFNELLETILRKLDRHNNKHILLLGDFNIDLIKHDKDIHGQDLIDSTSNHGYIQIISRPTRITDHSATLIDHIYSNKINNVVSSSVVTLDLSDHLATLATISLDGNYDSAQRPMKNKRNDSEQCDYRIFNSANDEKFRQLITDEIWDIPDGLDAQAQYDSLIEIYTKHYNTAYPLNTKRIRRKNERVLPKPWILPWLEDACDRKNRLYFSFIKDPNIANKTKYIKMKKFVEKHIKRAKSEYYKNYFEQHKDNSKKQWRMINSLLNRSSKKISITKIQDCNGDIINTPIAIAEKFNDYFSNIASNLKSSRNNNSSYSSDDFECFLTQPVSNSIYVKPVAPGEVYEIIKNMKNKATLDTKVSALKLASLDPKFTTVLANVITSSFEQGIFPQSLKLARVVPVFKSGTKTDVSNYRPISLLTSFSKIYEKLMHNRIVSFMETNNSLYEMQYGFRAGRSCEHALLKAQSLLLESLNKNQISLLLFIDFSKAFDMVEHQILLKKLYHYGIRGTALNWLRSYLDNREQFVSVNGKDSSIKQIKYGVPQGSILGPLLFVIYINDIPNISNFAKFILYADDANIIVTGNSIAEIEEQLSDLTIALSKWVNVNGLKLNLKKTNYMIFSRRKLGHNLNVVIEGTEIQRTSEARFLGVLVDDKLNWSHHIKTLKSKMSRYVGIMYRVKSLLPIQARLQIFHSFVQSHINFCSLVWGFSAKSNIDSLFVCQKKALRAVMPGYVNFFYKDGLLPAHTKASFNKFKILTVHGVIARNALIFIHKIRNFPQLVPSSVRETIASDAPTRGSSYETCQEWLDNFGTSVYSKSIFFKGPLIYIEPDTEELETPKSLCFINLFKSSSKKLLLKLQNNGDSDEWQSDNFLLFRIRGLRKSCRLN